MNNNIEYEEELRKLQEKQKELETKIEDMNKKIDRHDLQIGEIIKEYTSIKDGLNLINNNILLLSTKIENNELIDKKQEEDIKETKTHLIEEKDRLLKVLLYITGVSFSGLTGLKILEYIINLF